MVVFRSDSSRQRKGQGWCWMLQGTETGRVLQGGTNRTVVENQGFLS